MRHPKHTFHDTPVLRLSVSAIRQALEEAPDARIKFHPRFAGPTGYFEPLLAKDVMPLEKGEAAWTIDAAGRWLILANTSRGPAYFAQRYSDKQGVINTTIVGDGGIIKSAQSVDIYDILDVLTRFTREQKIQLALAKLCVPKRNDIDQVQLADLADPQTPEGGLADELLALDRSNHKPTEDKESTMNNEAQQNQNARPVPPAAISDLETVELPVAVDAPRYSGWRKAGLVTAGVVVGVGATIGVQQYLASRGEIA